MLYLPPQIWSSASAPRAESPVVPAATLNETASPASTTQLTVAADAAPLRIAYGRVRLGAQIANVVPYGSSWVVQAVWADGPIEAIESLWANDSAFSGTAVHYLGDDATPAADPTLVAAFASNGITYADTLPGIAYSVITLPAADLAGMPQLAAIIKGRQLYDPRSTLTAWSANPALALADFLGSVTYGLGMTLDWASVETVADACDELVSGSPRRALGLVLDHVQDARAWVEALRTYAGCWVVAEDGTAKLVPDRPRATDRSLTHAAGQIARLGRIKKRGTARLPNRVEIRYTDTSATPWRDASVWSPGMGLATGVPDAQVALPGIQSAAMAYREAVERLNKLWLSDLSVEVDLFDEALDIEVGDVIELTHPVGLAAKKLRVLSLTSDYGRFKIAALEYDPAVYSDAVQAEPTTPDTDLPNPAAPPALAGFTATEEVYQLANGTYASRIRATWTAPAWPYLHRYYVEAWAGPTLMVSGTTEQTSFATPPVAEGTAYTVRAAVVSSVGATGEWASASLTAAGKYLIPGDVPAVTAFEAGGRVYINWEPAADLDIWRYEVRYVAAGGAWADATLIDRADNLRLQTDQIPTGTWDLLVKAIDSVGQYSTNAASVEVTVTSDANSFLIDRYDQTAPTLTNMVAFTLAPTDATTYYVTDTGAATDTRLTGATLAAYTDPLSTYHASCTSTWLGESEDFGLVLGGQWTGSADVTDVSGSHTSYLGLSDDDITWAYASGLSHKDTGRFSRLKHESTTTSTLLVAAPTQQIRLDAIPREEVGSGTSSATGATTITLDGEYAAVKKITITPEGTTARSSTYDNIVLGAPTTFDVYVFNDAGSKIASPFRYSFQGV